MAKEGCGGTGLVREGYRDSGLVGEGYRDVGLVGEGYRDVGLVGEGYRDVGLVGEGYRDVGLVGEGYRDVGLVGEGYRDVGLVGEGSRDVGLVGEGSRDVGLVGEGYRDVGLVGEGYRDVGLVGEGYRDVGLVGEVAEDAAGVREAPRGLGCRRSQGARKGGGLGSPDFGQPRSGEVGKGGAPASGNFRISFSLGSGELGLGGGSVHSGTVERYESATTFHFSSCLSRFCILLTERSGPALSMATRHWAVPTCSWHISPINCMRPYGPSRDTHPSCTHPFTYLLHLLTHLVASCFPIGSLCRVCRHWR